MVTFILSFPPEVFPYQKGGERGPARPPRGHLFVTGAPCGSPWGPRPGFCRARLRGRRRREGKGQSFVTLLHSCSQSFSVPKCGRGKPALVRRHTLEDRSELISCIENGNYAKAARIAAGEPACPPCPRLREVAVVWGPFCREGSGSPTPWASIPGCLCETPLPPPPTGTAVTGGQREFHPAVCHFLCGMLHSSVQATRTRREARLSIAAGCGTLRGGVAPPIAAPRGAPRTGWCWLVSVGGALTAGGSPGPWSGRQVPHGARSLCPEVGQKSMWISSDAAASVLEPLKVVWAKCSGYPSYPALVSLGVAGRGVWVWGSVGPPSGEPGHRAVWPLSQVRGCPAALVGQVSRERPPRARPHRALVLGELLQNPPRVGAWGESSGGTVGGSQT